jgi:predicted HicB family RNase H-like nuclease
MATLSCIRNHYLLNCYSISIGIMWKWIGLGVRIVVFNATFNNISGLHYKIKDTSNKLHMVDSFIFKLYLKFCFRETKENQRQWSYQRGVITIRISKNIQHNYQKKKYKKDKQRSTKHYTVNVLNIETLRISFWFLLSKLEHCATWGKTTNTLYYETKDRATRTLLKTYYIYMYSSTYQYSFGSYKIWKQHLEMYALNMPGPLLQSILTNNFVH